MLINGHWKENITCPRCRYRHPADISCKDAELIANNAKQERDQATPAYCIWDGDLVVVPIELVMAAEKFVQRCEDGSIKSERTYKELKDALTMLYELQEK